jgi:histidinol phosphatase-like PHP family hydrolase
MLNGVGWALLHGHSHFSLLDGLGKPEKIAKRCADYGYPAVALTDHGTTGRQCRLSASNRRDYRGVKDATKQMCDELNDIKWEKRQ